MADPIRIGIVGAGGNTRTMHIPKLQEIDGVQIVCVANRSRESGQAVADQFGIPTVHADWTEVVMDPEVDAVVIGTWPYLHCPVTCAALDAGKHVLVEARMALNADEAHQMLAVSREHPQLVAQIVPSPFTFTWDATIHHTIASGRLGDILAIDLRGSTGDFPDFDSAYSWRHNRDLSGMNIMAMGIWYEALMRWVGHAESLYAMAQTVVKTRASGDGTRAVIEIPDHVDILARMRCGAQARLQFSAVCGHAESEWGCWIYGSEGTIHLDARAGVLRFGSRVDDAMQDLPVDPKYAGAWRVERDFIDAIRGIAPVKLTRFEDGVRYMEFTEAVTRSFQSDSPVALPL